MLLADLLEIASVDEYCTKMSSPDAPGDTLVLAAATHIFKRYVVITFAFSYLSCSQTWQAYDISDCIGRRKAHTALGTW